MQKLASALLCLLIGATPCFAQRDQVMNALVRIYAVRGSQAGSSIGAGVFIDRTGIILTAYHVVQGARSLEVYGPHGPLMSPRLVAFDERRDLATIQVSSPVAITSVPVGPVPTGLIARQGRAYGHPDGKPSFAVLVNFARDAAMQAGGFLVDGGKTIFAATDIEIIPLDATLNSGMSGGPVVVDGRVIGIVSGSQSQGRNFGWAIPASVVTALKPATNVTFAQAPPLRMLLASNAPTLLRSTLPPARQETLARLSEVVRAAEESYADWSGRVGAQRVRIREISIFPMGPLPEDRYRSRVATATAVLGEVDAFIAAHELFLKDVRAPVASQAISEGEELVSTYEEVMKIGRALVDISTTGRSREEQDAIKARRSRFNTASVFIEARSKSIHEAVRKLRQVNVVSDYTVVDGELRQAAAAYKSAALAGPDDQATLPALRRLIRAESSVLDARSTGWQAELEHVRSGLAIIHAFLETYTSPQLTEVILDR